MKTESRIVLRLALVVFLMAGLFHSCTKEESPAPAPEPSIPDTPEEEETCYITDTVYYTAEHITVYRLIYPSTDPYGQPVMLSAAIVLSDDIVQSRQARGLLLYNHFSIFRADECPTRSNLATEKKMAPGGLITVSPDYYGFGITEQEPQAYCMASVNAQASVDALLATKQLLSRRGYQWDDYLFVGGYSQGGQTTMGVVRLVAEHYPDLHITYAFAGAGPYNIPATYSDMVAADIAGQPSTVISVLLTYNRYCNLNIALEEMFKEPLLSHIDDWFLSKQYSRTEIDALMGGLTMSQFVTPALLDIDSELSQRFLQTFDADNLCKGWTPRGDEHIMLFHNTSDITVPPSNTDSLYNFLQRQGLEVELIMQDYGATDNVDGHELGAIFFAASAINRLAEILQVSPWSIF